MRHPLAAMLVFLLLGIIHAGLALADPPPQAQTLAIGRMLRPPILDGRLADWPVAARFLLGEAGQTLRRPGRWGGTPDSAAAIRLAWDPEFLYLAADVSDDRLMQAGDGAQPWQGDTLELFFNIHPGQQRVDGFWQIALIPPLKPGEKLRVVGPQKDFEGVEGTALVHQGGYTLECRIPWKNLDGFKPAVNASLGFQVMLDDRDDNGRKSQLVWYPSAITFAHPMDTNTLILKSEPETGGTSVLAGPATAVVTDPKNLYASVIADVDGADHAVVEIVHLQPIVQRDEDEWKAKHPASLRIQLRKTGDRIATGSGGFGAELPEGSAEFSVRVENLIGETIGFQSFKTELAGRRYQALVDGVKLLQSQVKALPESTNPVNRAGIAGQVQRLADMIPNEARPETISADLLGLLMVELASTENGLRILEKGSDPFPRRCGSMIRAYQSPLTGALRTYALHVPPGSPAPDDEGEAKPLIVVLHPIFADERFLLMAPPALRETGAIVYQGAAYRQLDWSGVNAAETRAGLEDVIRHYKVDPNRIYLIGVHIGGRGVLQLATAMPDLFAAIAPLYPGIDTRPSYPALRLYPEYFESASNVQIPQFKPIARPEPLVDPLELARCRMLSLATKAPNIDGVPARLAFGEDDPDAAAERLALWGELRDLKSDFPCRYSPGAMHGNMPSELGDPAFYRWLLSQTRQSVHSGPIRFVATNLRDDRTWWVRVDQMESPGEPAIVDGWVDDEKRFNLKTSGVARLTLFPAEMALDRENSSVIGKLLAQLQFGLSSNNAASKLDAGSINIDGQPLRHKPQNPSCFVLGKDGQWKEEVPFGQGEKIHGLAGPIDDFQFDRFVVVYGTGGSEEQNTALKKAAQSIADWGLGTTFPIKPDKELTDEDRKTCHLLLVGTPDNNAVIKGYADRLPLKWHPDSLELGGLTAKGPGAGACMIFPNPDPGNRYLVVITGLDPSGYQVWGQRTGWDYVLGHSEPGKTTFVSTAKGWFDNKWSWSADLASTKENP